jgi:hypothetical protein
MKFFAPLILFFSISVARADCHLFEVKGEVQADNHKLIIRLGEETLSDVKLAIPIEEQLKALPLIDEWVRALIIIKDDSLAANREIIKIQNIELAVRDPLNEVPQETRRLKGEVPCP